MVKCDNVQESVLIQAKKKVRIPTIHSSSLCKCMFLCQGKTVSQVLWLCVTSPTSRQKVNCQPFGQKPLSHIYVHMCMCL